MLPLVVGRVYRRREDLHAYFGGQQQGGISTPARHPVVLLFTGEQGVQYGYEDGFHGDIFWYTGEGQLGNMEMRRTGNLAIKTHREQNKDLLLFKYVGTGKVQFLGNATYQGHHTEVAPDREGKPRDVIVFELAIEAPADGEPDLAPEDAAIPPSLLRRPLYSLREDALIAAQKDVSAAARKSIAYHRSEVVRAYVLVRARGKCEGCETPAPFVTPRHIPYLEPHHIRRRADRGPDHPQWVIALCPNCHARVHYGADGHEFNVHLAERVSKIESALAEAA
jgi:5-methylcytosine-specific restriction protein A